MSLFKTDEDINKAWMTLCKDKMLWADFQVLFQMAINKSVIVELGTARGIGAMVLSSHGGKVYTVDNQKNSESIKNYLFDFWNIEYISGDTAETSSRFCDASIDLLYIDGGHSYLEVERDYIAWFSKVKEGGLILFHDYSNEWPGVKNFINEKILTSKKVREVEILCPTVIKTFQKI